MKTVVTVLVFDRAQNLQRWLEIWKKCEQTAELRVIHNVHSPSGGDEFRKMCNEVGVTYIPRKNHGMDIGAFQDVCKKRLTGFKHDFDLLLWFTDDCFPVSPDFVRHFTEPMKFENMGVTCYAISQEYKTHIRTTGFCIRASLLPQLKFPVDTIETKEHCWQFEHKGVNLYSQIVAMSLSVLQIAPIDTAPVWDSGHKKYRNREHEIREAFGLKPPARNVAVLCPAFERYPVICASMMAQTHQDWALHLVHDGPAKPEFVAAIPKDPRIRFASTDTRGENYGHHIRQSLLAQVMTGEIDCQYLLITNEDNYHMPQFLEKMVEALEKNPNMIAAYCDMVHNYKSYEMLPARLQRGFLDCGSVVTRKDAASVGWRSMDHSSDWIYFEDIIRKYGADKWLKIPGVHFVHN